MFCAVLHVRVTLFWLLSPAYEAVGRYCFYICLSIHRVCVFGESGWSLTPDQRYTPSPHEAGSGSHWSGLVRILLELAYLFCKCDLRPRKCLFPMSTIILAIIKLILNPKDQCHTERKLNARIWFDVCHVYHPQRRLLKVMFSEASVSH